MNRNTLHPLCYLPVLVLMAACAPSSGPDSSATTGARWSWRHPDSKRRRTVGIVDHASGRARAVGANAHVRK
jgi:hypothetical protein